MTQTIQWTKPVCQLDSDGLYLGQTDADLDTYAKDGSYLIPAGCIEAEPPAEKSGHAARWTGSGWEYLPDFRGQTAYQTANGQAFTVNKVGELSDGLTFEAPPSPAHTWNGKGWTLTKEAQATQLVQAKAAKLAEVNAAAQAFIDQAAGLEKLPKFEVETWTLQALEAKAWKANPAAATPSLDAIAQARGIPADVLKQKAYDKTVKFELLTARTAGLRQSAEDQIKAAKTLKELDAVSVVFHDGAEVKNG